MKRVTFSEFFAGVKDRLEGDQFKLLDPSHMFFEHNGTYIGLTFNVKSNTLWVSWVVGKGIDWAWEIKRVCQSMGVRYVGFTTKKETVKKIAKYFKAAPAENGTDYYIDLQATRA